MLNDRNTSFAYYHGVSEACPLRSYSSVEAVLLLRAARSIDSATLPMNPLFAQQSVCTIDRCLVWLQERSVDRAALY